MMNRSFLNTVYLKTMLFSLIAIFLSLSQAYAQSQNQAQRNNNNSERQKGQQRKEQLQKKLDRQQKEKQKNQQKQQLRPEKRNLQDKAGDKTKQKLESRGFQTLPSIVDAQTSISLMLGCPAASTIVLNVLSSNYIDGYVEYHIAGDNKNLKTQEQAFQANVPAEIQITGLQANKKYSYSFVYRRKSMTKEQKTPEHTFHTQRAPGSSFSFEIQGDSHPERPHQFDATLYASTLQAAAKDQPDFYLTIGDDFSVDTLNNPTRNAVEKIYLNQQYYLSLLGSSCPVFLVNGNHEQAAAYNLSGDSDNIAVWAQKTRNLYFPQPAPDSFYSGDKKQVENIGLLRDYYSWTWGDALFVVIDPYWHSSSPVDNVYGGGEKIRDLWQITLGNEQYKWFKETLENSKSKYKFVFTHHVLGTGRGGIERAGLFEWGGKNNKGEWEFDKKRPGWELPVHQLMAKNKVTIFFQGHDHLFARQELDGVIYQTLPNPADPNYTLNNKDAYTSGDIFPNSGRVRVNVSPEKIGVDYIRSKLQDSGGTANKEDIIFHYETPGNK